MAGDEESSNMYKIDLAMKSLSDSIQSLQERGTVERISATYQDVGYFIATSQTIIDYTQGMTIALSLDQTNNGPVSININEIGTVQIVYSDQQGQLQNVLQGMIVQNSIYLCVYNGTYWVMSSSGYSSTSNNVQGTINNKNISDIFESNGTTVKLSTLSNQQIKLQDPVSIGISGVTQLPQQFDGSSNITIPIQQVPGNIVTDVIKTINGEQPDYNGNITLGPEQVDCETTIIQQFGQFGTAQTGGFAVYGKATAIRFPGGIWRIDFTGKIEQNDQSPTYAGISLAALNNLTGKQLNISKENTIWYAYQGSEQQLSTTTFSYSGTMTPSVGALIPSRYYDTSGQNGTWAISAALYSVGTYWVSTIYASEQ